MAVDGTYNFKADSAMGEIKGKVTFKSNDDGTLLGTIEAMDDKVELQDGTYEDLDFFGKCEIKGPMGKMKLKVKGTVDGDKISGTLDAGLLKFPFEGIRE